MNSEDRLRVREAQDKDAREKLKIAHIKPSNTNYNKSDTYARRRREEWNKQHLIEVNNGLDLMCSDCGTVTRKKSAKRFRHTIDCPMKEK